MCAEQSRGQGIGYSRFILRFIYLFKNIDFFGVCINQYAMRDVKDMGQQMGYRSLEWNWPKEAMNRPIWASIVDGAKLF